MSIACRTTRTIGHGGAHQSSHVNLVGPTCGGLSLEVPGGRRWKTAYERLKGKKFSRAVVEFGEKVHFRKNNKGQKDNKLDGKWGEGYFLGFYWKTSEALVGTPEGVKRAGTIRRVGTHRRWDAEGLDKIRGVPWKWDLEADQVADRLMVRMLSEDEKSQLAGHGADAEDKTVYRMRLKRDDFVS